jgi:nitrite reductase (NADH) small subunit
VVARLLAQLDELRAEIGLQVRVDGWDYAMWLQTDGQVRVLDNACQHVGGPLVDGALAEGCVVCPWHGWRYDLATGQRHTAIGPLPGVRSYRAWIEGAGVWVDLPEDQLARP